MSTFGETLQRLRRGRLSQSALAVRAGTSQSYISRVETGALVPTVAQAEHLLNCLGYAMRIEADPLPARTDPGALLDQLAMSAEERMMSAAALHNAMAEMREGLG